MESQGNLHPRHAAAASAPDAAQKLPPTGTRVKYAIAHHTGIAQPHFDLFLEVPAATALLTWRIPTPPKDWPTTPPPNVERLADHRLMYMTYEGPVSNNRGKIERVVAGSATITEQSSDHIRVCLESPLTCAMDLPT